MGGDDGLVWLWGDTEDDPAARIDVGAPIGAIAFSPDGLLAASSTAAVSLWDAETGDLVAELSSGDGRAVGAVAFSPDGQTLAGGGQDGAVLLWTMADHAAAPRTLAGHTAAVDTVAFSPDGTLLASGSADRTVRLWTLAQPNAAPLILSARDVIASVAFDPAGRMLAAGGFEGNVWLWDPNSPLAIPAVLAGQVGAITAVDFSPDGRWVAAGGDEGVIQLWDVPSRSTVGTLAGHTGSVLDVRFTRGDVLASSALYGSPIVWSLGLESLRWDACRLVNRDLSEEEWRELAPDQPFRAVCATILTDEQASQVAADGASDRATP
jgi:WD40 repeat protein